MPGKKKATGMSKRQSFLDRNVIAENNEILRFNEGLADAARGVREPRTTGTAGGREGARRSSRSTRPARGPRPPAVPPEQETELRTAAAAATDDAEVAAAGGRLVDALVRGDRFERATEAGWGQLSTATPAAERSSEDWDRLRLAFASVRRSVLDEWVKTHPDAAPLQQKEEKASVRASRPPAGRTRTKRPRRPLATAGAEEPSLPAGPPGELEPAADTSGSTTGPEGRARRPRRRRPRRGASQAVAPGDAPVVAPDPAPGEESAAPEGDSAVEPSPPVEASPAPPPAADNTEPPGPQPASVTPGDAETSQSED